MQWDRSLFPTVEPPFDELDGRRWYAEEAPPAPIYNLKNVTVGHQMLLEGLASIVQAGFGPLDDSHPFLCDAYQADATRALNEGIASKYKGLAGLFFDRFTARLFTDAGSGAISRKKGVVETIIAFAELALNPALLPCQVSLWTRKPTWFDLHPGYRFCDLCHNMAKIGLCEKSWNSLSRLA